MLLELYSNRVRMNYFSKPCLWPLFYSILQAVRRLSAWQVVLVSLVNLLSSLSVEPETGHPEFSYPRFMFPPTVYTGFWKWLQASSSPLASRWGHMTKSNYWDRNRILHVYYLLVWGGHVDNIYFHLWWSWRPPSEDKGSWGEGKKLGSWSKLGGKPSARNIYLGDRVSERQIFAGLGHYDLGVVCYSKQPILIKTITIS